MDYKQHKGNLRGQIKNQVERKLYNKRIRAEAINVDTSERQLTIPDVICSPILAKIEHINDLGKSTWYEVVYYDDKWYSYSGSKTFEDGEQVVKWKYAKDCI